MKTERKIILAVAAMSLIVFVAGTASAALVADSEADYGTVQGTNGWWYLGRGEGGSLDPVTYPSGRALVYEAGYSFWSAHAFAPWWHPFMTATDHCMLYYNSSEGRTKTDRRWISDVPAMGVATIYGSVGYAGGP